MRIKNALIAFLCLVFIQSLTAQEGRFFVPQEFQKAYDAGTRSIDGKPGPNYWTNTVAYDMEVTIDPQTRSIEGSGTATYTNNSPDDLNTLVVRLYYDVYRKANPRDSRVIPEDITDGVALSSLAINGVEMDIDSRNVRRVGTNLYISLPESLESGGTLTMSTSWKQYIPLTNRRTGVADSTSFFVAYWYPQIAVYDDVFGWDTEQYGFRTEFYNELADFDVRINVPKSYTVWATGRLTNPEAVLQNEVLGRYREALTSTETVSVLNADDMEGGFEHAGGTWHFTASEVPDFAFGLSDHYLWDAAIQKVDGRDVLIESAFPLDDAGSYAELTELQRKIMQHFSEDMPGIPYPFSSFTTFIGLQGGGMEFPMMAYNASESRGLTMHEMYHMYFPMYVQTNERLYAWMDEGWADYITTYVTVRYFEESDEPLFGNYKSSIQGMMGSYEDLPLMVSSQYLDGGNYGYASYPLPGFLYSVLNHHLGDEVFKEAYQEYIRRWAQKHPTPYDFFYTMEDVSGEDLSWFWKPWFFDRGYADLKIEEVKKNKLMLRNAGARPVPLQVDVEYEDGSTERIIASAVVWKDDSEHTVTIPRHKEMKALSVNRNVADYNERDNFYPTLEERMASFDIPGDMAGTYLVSGYNVNMYIEEVDGLLEVRVPATGMRSVILPKGDGGSFISLDETMKLIPQKEGESIEGMEMVLDQFGITLTAQKQD